MINEIEQNFSCPYCGENISMLLDLSEAQQQYIEDCEVCCRPIEINFTVVEDKIHSFNALPSDS
jgi:transcription elongation factor Elf1